MNFKIRLKVQHHKVQEMIKHTDYAEDVVERLITYNIRDVVLADTQKPNLEDVLIIKLDYGWGCNTRAIRGEGTGRMKYLKDVQIM